MSNFVKIAVVQMASMSQNPDLEARKREHIQIMENYIDIICHINPTVDFILFPEICIQGLPPEDYTLIAETIPGAATDVFCKKAKQYGKWILPGSIIEKREGVEGTLNTAILISPEGEIALKHSKVFIPYPLEHSTPGSEFSVLDIPGIGKVGMLICADILAPETARNLALKGAEIIFKPSYHGYWAGAAHTQAPICQTRAIENQCFVVNINQPAPLSMGHSCVCDPDGNILKEVGESETFFIASLNMEEVRKARECDSLDMLPILKILKEVKEIGRPIDECYTNGITNASVYETITSPLPKTAEEMKKYGE